MTAEQTELLQTLERADEVLAQIAGRGLKFADLRALGHLKDELEALGAVNAAVSAGRLLDSRASEDLLKLQAFLLVLDRLLTREVALADEP